MYCPAYKLWMQQLRAQGISMRILAVGYPLCPEHPFPAPVKAAAAAYRWLLDQLKAEGRNDTVILGEGAESVAVDTSTELTPHAASSASLMQ
jgi:hypothetical protein